MSQTRYIQPLEPRTLLSVTAPDPSFGNGGSVKVPADEALGVLPDEKILSVGDVSEGVDGGYVDTIVSRLNPDGTLDSSFGTAGQLKFKRSNFSSSLVGSRLFLGGTEYTSDGVRKGSLGYGALSVDGMPDGGLLLLAIVNDVPNLIKLDANNKLDKTFGNNGFVVVSSVASPFNSVQDAVIVTPKGILVLTNISTGFVPTGVVVTRYTLAGKLDTSFATNGSFKFDVPLSGMLAQADGKVLLISSFRRDKDTRVIRLNLDGSLDSSFGSSGTLLLKDRSGHALDVFNPFLDPQGGLWVDGGLILNSLFRYSGNGVPDGAPFNGTFRESNEDRITGDRAVADSKGHTLIGGELGITRLAMAKPIVVGRDHVLYIAGTSGKDQMTVKTALDGNVSITINGSTSQVARSGLTGININGSEGNNQIISAVGLPTTILSGSGNDRIVSGKEPDTVVAGDGADTVSTGSGNDQIDGGLGANVLDCGFGDDSITIDEQTPNPANNSIAGGDGNKTIRVLTRGATTIKLGTGNSSINLDFNSGNDTITIAGGSNDVRLSGGRDTLTIGGNGKNDVDTAFDCVGHITTGDGDDTIRLFGSATVNSNGGNDTITDQGDGTLTFNAGSGDDHVSVRSGDGATGHGGDGNDLLEASSGLQSFFGDGGNDTIRGFAGGDTLDGGSGRDLLYGGAGDDHMAGGPGNDTLHGEAGNDRMLGDSEDDQLYGGDGNDTLDGGAGRDYLNGNDGDDVFVAADGEKDSLFGGRGLDHAGYDKGLDVLDGVEKPL